MSPGSKGGRRRDACPGCEWGVGMLLSHSLQPLHFLRMSPVNHESLETTAQLSNRASVVAAGHALSKPDLIEGRFQKTTRVCKKIPPPGLFFPETLPYISYRMTRASPGKILVLPSQLKTFLHLYRKTDFHSVFSLSPAQLPFTDSG
jgi:hypothetical protein